MPRFQDYLLKSAVLGVQNIARLFGTELYIEGERNEVTFHRGLPKDMDPIFQRIYMKCRPYTMTSLPRMYALYQATKYVVENKIPGDFVECGVWKGGSVMMIAHTLAKLDDTNRTIYLFDTFKGMTPPSSRDVRISDNAPAHSLTNQQGDHDEYAYASLQEVRKNIYSTPYPQEKFVLVQGDVKDTIPHHGLQDIALLRLDTDWYESTKHEMTHLFPLISQNGVLIIDDYGHFSGSRDAVDEYFSTHSIRPLMNRIDYTSRLIIKHIAP